MGSICKYLIIKKIRQTLISGIYVSLRESSNKKVAVVNRNGVITGKGKGTCYVYAYAQNGIFRKTKVTVK